MVCMDVNLFTCIEDAIGAVGDVAGASASSVGAIFFIFLWKSENLAKGSKSNENKKPPNLSVPFKIRDLAK